MDDHSPARVWVPGAVPDPSLLFAAADRAIRESREANDALRALIAQTRRLMDERMALRSGYDALECPPAPRPPQRHDAADWGPSDRR
jgi:hypothetical protein